MKLRELFQELIRVQQAFKIAPTLICGGTVRDKYMNQLEHMSDLDLTNGNSDLGLLSQEFAIELRKKYDVTRKVYPDHSTIFVGNLKLDFSSNFVVPNIDLILAKLGVAKPTNLQREMFSRDFTCNSLLMSLDLKDLFDPTTRGFDDIDAKKIKTCLAPELTLTSNKNRVIRAIYLACKLGFDIDDGIVNYVAKNPASVKISSTKTLTDKLNLAFENDADRASYYLTKMNLWGEVPITEKVAPYYKASIKGTTKLAYFQGGGGGINEPKPGQPKYKAEKAIQVQPRFKEPFYRNYDTYFCSGVDGEPKHGPGSGYTHMNDYKSVKEFFDARRKQLKDKYVADDSYIEDTSTNHKERVEKMQIRAKLLFEIVKTAAPNNHWITKCRKCDSVVSQCRCTGTKQLQYVDSCPHCKRDSNNTDYQVDQQSDESSEAGPVIGNSETFTKPSDIGPAINSDPSTMPSVVGLGDQTDYPQSNQLSGFMDGTVPQNDFEDKSPDQLNFGRDYVNDEFPANLDEDALNELANKYLTPAESDLLGIPGGITPSSDLDADNTTSNEGAYYSGSNIGTQPYGAIA